MPAKPKPDPAADTAPAAAPPHRDARPKSCLGLKKRDPQIRLPSLVRPELRTFVKHDIPLRKAAFEGRKSDQKRKLERSRNRAEDTRRPKTLQPRMGPVPSIMGRTAIFSWHTRPDATAERRTTVHNTLRPSWRSRTRTPGTRQQRPPPPRPQIDDAAATEPPISVGNQPAADAGPTSDQPTSGHANPPPNRKSTGGQHQTTT